MDRTICIRIRDGKIMVARKGKPFFPEPLEKDVIELQDNEEGFLIGPYPMNNTMIMPFDRYQNMFMELRKNCPNARSWRITAMVFIGMFVVLSMMHLHQWSYFQDLLKDIRARIGLL